MRQRWRGWSLPAAVLVLGACSSGSEPHDGPPDPPSTAGSLVLWVSSPGRGTLRVVANDVTYGSFQSAPPAGGTAPASCDGSLPSYAFRMRVSPGFYRIKVTAQTGEVWDFEEEVVEGECRIRELAETPAPPPEAVGKIAFWTDVSTQVPITVRVDTVLVGLISNVRSTQPSCGASDALTVTVPAGVRQFTAEGNAGMTWGGPVSVPQDGCVTLKLIAGTPPPPSGNGQLTLWTRLPVAGDPISLTVDNVPAGALVQSLGALPACGGAGAVTLTLPPGQHRVQGDQAGARIVWDFSATVTRDQCNRIELTGPNVATGQLLLWTAFSLAGQIDVSLNGSPAGSITQYRTSIPTACGVAGALTLTLPAGNYTVTARSGNGFQWTNPVVAPVAPGGCYAFRFLGPGGTAGAPGRVAVWGARNGVGPIGVSMDRVPVGTISLIYSSAPLCDSPGVVSAWLDPGDHLIEAQSTGGVVWNGTQRLNPAVCLLVGLQ